MSKRWWRFASDESELGEEKLTGPGAEAHAELLARCWNETIRYWPLEYPEHILTAEPSVTFGVDEDEDE